MKMTPTVKFCPICNNENVDTALICRHCGARLDEISTGYVAIPEYSEGHVSVPAAQMESFIDVELIPEEGIGVQVAGETKPLYAPISGEIIIGRTSDGAPAPEAFLDLSNLNAGTMGVSRRHVMIRRTASGYEVVDLSSRNGTWLNAERLVPDRPYPFPSGSQLRIGNMRLLIMYHPVVKDDKQS
jgi:hypothetical protein